MQEQREQTNLLSCPCLSIKGVILQSYWRASRQFSSPQCETNIRRHISKRVGVSLNAEKNSSNFFVSCFGQYFFRPYCKNSCFFRSMEERWSWIFQDTPPCRQRRQRRWRRRRRPAAARTEKFASPIFFHGGNYLPHFKNGRSFASDVAMSFFVELEWTLAWARAWRPGHNFKLVENASVLKLAKLLWFLSGLIN